MAIAHPQMIFAAAVTACNASAMESVMLLLMIPAVAGHVLSALLQLIVLEIKINAQPLETALNVMAILLAQVH